MKAEYSVTVLCLLMEVSASGYYEWLKRLAKPSNNQY